MSRDQGKIIPFPGVSPTVPGLQFRIELLLVAEPVWRRIVVPGHYSFWDLHIAIQDAMGWEDRHLHQFKIDDPRTGVKLRFGIPDASRFHGASEVLTGWDHRPADHFRRGLGPALYSYDFGDEWQHEVHLEEILTSLDAQAGPDCLDGEGLCPQEDCGGPFAWEEYLAEHPSTEKFRPEEVVFDNPHERWIRTFGHD